MRLAGPSGSSRASLVAALLLTAAFVVVAAPPAGGQAGPGDADRNVQFTITGLELGCEETFCFDVPVAAVQPNSTLNITFVNPSGNTLHSFYVLSDGDISPGGDMPEEDAEAFVDTLREDESGSLSYEVPEDASVLYLWCGEPGHEEGGMWEFVTVGAGQAPPGGEGGLVAQQVGVPLFSYWVGVIAIFALFGWLAIAFFVLRFESSNQTDHRDRKRS